MVDEQNPPPVGMGANILKHWKEPDIYQYQLVPRCVYASIAHVMPIRHWQRDLQSHILHELQMPFPCSALSVYHCPLCNYVGGTLLQHPDATHSRTCNLSLIGKSGSQDASERVKSPRPNLQVITCSYQKKASSQQSCYQRHLASMGDSKRSG